MPCAARAGLCAVALVLAAACTKSPDPAVTGTTPYDPYEASNRRNHAFNKAVDRAFVSSDEEGTGLPEDALTVAGNFSENLSMPGAIVNNMLQGNGRGATSDFYRFLVNTTLGLGGLIDTATDLGMPAATDADFGQTLYVWGVHEGPYVELPFIGPATSRAAAGRVVDIFTNPLRYAYTDNDVYYATGAHIAGRLDDRARYDEAIDALIYDSADSYAAARSLYLQRRRFELEDGGSGAMRDPYDTTAGEPASAAPPVSADFEDPYDQ